MRKWETAENGCFILSYDAFKTIHNWKQKPEKPNWSSKTSKTKNPDPLQLEQWINESKQILLNCADIVVCDEGHSLKDSATILNQSVSEMKTKRRIILSGTPIQNNLIECKYTILFHEVERCIHNFYISFHYFHRLQYDSIYQEWIPWLNSKL